MRMLGLIGGISWESTAHYYALLNRMIRARLGGFHSSRLLLWSVDFAEIERLQVAGKWDEAGVILAEAARRLEGAGAEAILICANSMHITADAVKAAIEVPLIHIADATAAALNLLNARKPLLLGTRYVMEMDFYRARMRELGMPTIVPDAENRARLHAIIFDELVMGRTEPSSKAALLAMIEAARVRDGADSVIFGCTEIGLLLTAEESPIPAVDTSEAHVRAGIDFALSRSA